VNPIKLGLLLGGVLLAPMATAQISGGVSKAAAGEEQTASSSLDMWAAQIKIIRGQPLVERNGQMLNAVVGMLLKPLDILTTSANAAVGMTFNDNSTLSVGPNSSILIQRFIFDTTTHQGYFDTQVKRGTVAVQPGQIARKSPEAMRVFTRSAELRSQAAGYVVTVPGGTHE